MALDPITMKPDQLIFAHWKLGDTYSSTLEDLRTISYQGADLNQMKELDAQLDDIEEQLKLSETFLKLGGYTDMEIYQ